MSSTLMMMNRRRSIISCLWCTVSVRRAICGSGGSRRWSTSSEASRPSWCKATIGRRSIAVKSGASRYCQSRGTMIYTRRNRVWTRS
uniref:Putative secreted peptide n=1 Tax=Anopheles braziliensis TaxID=58242 RepID=A0A2M3ZSY3_9DIPT